MFLDEVSFDNKCMLRRYGFGGERLLYRGEFNRQPWVCFCSVNGIIDAFVTNNTFDREVFVLCCKTFIDNEHVSCYPGRHSVWILDGARIHCNSNIMHFLRASGLIPIFLPAYCPFFNPI
ncbi:serine/threonine-protein kinase rio2 [Thraustotheca clavata]|uniref:Serine/threonine-protein kinase rio2 n=1 Tax=Thraustotheca clavata TaxID=74557 RepID=A0A1V9ZV01_9STRA|nr:serine/threonine-protein kinase rio2 [Thraustotheca clavata]